MTPKAFTALAKLALSYPETAESMVCARSSFKARNKSFLFMGLTEDGFDVMVKLQDSLAAAARCAAKQPATYKLGVNGWVTAAFRQGQVPPPGLLEAWIDESYRLLAPRQLVAQLPAPAPKKAAKAKSRGKKR